MFCIHSLLCCQMLCGKGFEDGMCVGGCGIEIQLIGLVAILPHLQYPRVANDRFTFISSGSDIIWRVLLAGGTHIFL